MQSVGQCSLLNALPRHVSSLCAPTRGSPHHPPASHAPLCRSTRTHASSHLSCNTHMSYGDCPYAAAAAAAAAGEAAAVATPRHMAVAPTAAAAAAVAARLEGVAEGLRGNVADLRGGGSASLEASCTAAQRTHERQHTGHTMQRSLSLAFTPRMQSHQRASGHTAGRCSGMTMPRATFRHMGSAYGHGHLAIRSTQAIVTAHYIWLRLRHGQCMHACTAAPRRAPLSPAPSKPAAPSKPETSAGASPQVSAAPTGAGRAAKPSSNASSSPASLASSGSLRAGGRAAGRQRGQSTHEVHVYT